MEPHRHRWMGTHLTFGHIIHQGVQHSTTNYSKMWICWRLNGCIMEINGNIASNHGIKPTNMRILSEYLVDNALSSSLYKQIQKLINSCEPNHHSIPLPSSKQHLTMLRSCSELESMDVGGPGSDPALGWIIFGDHRGSRLNRSEVMMVMMVMMVMW